MSNARNFDPGKNNAFIQMIRQAEEIWNDYKGLGYGDSSKKKKEVEKLQKKVQALQGIDWETEFELLKKVYS